MGHGWTHGMMPLDENPKYVDKEDKGNPINQWKVDMWQ